MGFLDAIKNAFNSGGIDVHVDTPDHFAWTDGVLPVTVTLTGHKTEPRTVTELRFVMREDWANDDMNSTATLTFVHSQRVELQPLQSVAVELEFPLEFHATEEAESSVMGRLLTAASTMPRNAPRYRLTVSSTIEGLGASKSASKRLRVKAG